MLNQKCTDCEASIPIPEDAVQGEIVTCPDCGLDLEVIVVGPTLAVKAVVVQKEDWGE